MQELRSLQFKADFSGEGATIYQTSDTGTIEQRGCELRAPLMGEVVVNDAIRSTCCQEQILKQNKPFLVSIRPVASYEQGSVKGGEGFAQKERYQSLSECCIRMKGNKSTF